MDSEDPVSDLTRRLRKNYDPEVGHEVDQSPATLVSLLQESAAKWPDRVATDFMGATLTYSELEEQSRKAASAMADMGVTAGDRVSLILPNCPQFICGFFGALALGAIAVAHNPLAPASELHTEIERVDSKLVLAWQKTVSKVASLSVPVLSVDLVAALPAKLRLALKLPIPKARKMRAQLCEKVPASIPSFDKLAKKATPLSTPAAVDPDDTVAMLHTGGTTGSPKSGHALEHEPGIQLSGSCAVGYAPPFTSRNHLCRTTVFPCIRNDIGNALGLSGWCHPGGISQI